MQIELEMLESYAKKLDNYTEVMTTKLKDDITQNPGQKQHAYVS